jgi:hypothetical protein
MGGEISAGERFVGSSQKDEVLRALGERGTTGQFFPEALAPYFFKRSTIFLSE